ncbi:MAG: FlgD immunoglobulin-like domain containing protein [Candidatus Eisenbacteria bacterium]
MRRGILRSAIPLLIVASATTAFSAGLGDHSWKYIRPTNTGVMGDYSTALWLDPQGQLYLGGFNPLFEEGGFSRFIESENRWENFSNVDYPIIGDVNDTYGSPRISDMVPDANGGLWMGTGRGLLYFDPAIGPDSFVRWDNTNSPMPYAGAQDIDIAPDGTIWVATAAGQDGGLVRFKPQTNEWKVWGYGTNEDNWIGDRTVYAASVQPKPDGGYLVWVETLFGILSYDSETAVFTQYPNNGAVGDLYWVCRNDGTDSSGNTWMFRLTNVSQHPSLDYRQPDGTWVVPPQPPFAFYALDAFRALDGGRAVLIGPGSEAWYFDGTTWHNRGEWRAGGFTYAIDMDDSGNIWVSGNGGAGRYDAEIGTWQRYRLTNTGLLDMWPRDIAFSPNGDLWVTENAAPGVGGIGMFDGVRWHNHNVFTYGLGEEWPFPTDNADAITFRPSTGKVCFNPMNNGIHEWNGSAYETIEEGGKSDGLVEDSFGRLWTMGNYFSFRYHDELGFHDVDIAGWGANVVTDPSRPGTVWGCANLEVVRTDGNYYFSRENVDLPELNALHDVLTTVAVEPSGAAWVGSTEGLFRIDAEAGTHQWWHNSNSDLPGDQCTPLAYTPDGLIWFTNFNSQGYEPVLVWFDGTTFGTLGSADGLPHAQIYDAEYREVPGGYELWLACASRGLAVLTVQTNDPADVDLAAVAGPSLLHPNHPNPFMQETDLSFTLGAPSSVRLEVFDASGRRVRGLVDGLMGEGTHTLNWDGRSDAGREVGSGVYFYRIETPNGSDERRMTLVR